MADLPNPEDLSDEELLKLVTGEDVTTEEAIKPEDTPPAPNPEEPPADPEPAAPQPDEPTPPASGTETPPAPNGNEPDPNPPSRREQLRVQQLLAKIQQDQPPKQPDEPTPNKALDYKEVIEGEDELYQQLETDRKQYGQDMFQRGRQEADTILFRTRLEVDAPRVEAKYPWLDPHNPEKFNPQRAKALNDRYLDFVGYDPRTKTVRNPDIRYSEYVDAEMEFARELAADEIAASTQNIQRQAAQTGLRPGGAGVPKLDLNKAPEAMSDEELKAKVASFMG